MKVEAIQPEVKAKELEHYLRFSNIAKDVETGVCIVWSSTWNSRWC
jgi:hypothetical protein